MDGYNLLFALKRPNRATLEEDRRELIRALERYCRITNQRARVYFDKGGPRTSKGGRVEVVYVAEDATADERIVAALDETSDRTAHRVVSSDRAIRKAAGRRGVTSWSVMQFWREVQARFAEEDREAPTGGKSEGITAGEAEAWLRTFGFGENAGNEEERQDPT